MRISRRKGIKRLRGNSVEQRIDRIGVGRLESVIGLKTKPGCIFLIECLVDSGGLYLFMVRAGMGNALPVCTAVSIICNGRRTSANIERTTEYRQGTPAVFP